MISRVLICFFIMFISTISCFRQLQMIFRLVVSWRYSGRKKEMNSKMSDMFFMRIVQDEKNQIITTNVWLNLVSSNKERHVDPLDQRK